MVSLTDNRREADRWLMVIGNFFVELRRLRVPGGVGRVSKDEGR